MPKTNARHDATDDPRPVRQRLIDSAEALFSEHGWNSVGIRTIAAHANVSLAALNYHFGSKEKLLGELFANRARHIVAERDRRLDAVMASGDVTLEKVIAAYLHGALSYEMQTGFGGRAFCKLRARLSVESEGLSRSIMSDAFDASGRRYLDVLKSLLPDLPEHDLFWRFHFLLGAMTYTMADSGRIQALTQGRCDSSDMQEALRQMVPFVAAGFRAPRADP
ncbi:TetR/AcrR family transcriptional regulator [Aquabacter spiritensis]|uniref:TetR family transcriptional regulator n=1 Tax=Aquabacter spiritensis TaxID=933073 RepID=A0A4R3LWB3_9HYPH|nr:TetR/AcrR family transcriptional regulator [Aquabacter spiritensis]TCT02945.1 TetR family transcriptional regulator [Aquabacter spiritensis]